MTFAGATTRAGNAGETFPQQTTDIISAYIRHEFTEINRQTHVPNSTYFIVKDVKKNLSLRLVKDMSPFHL